MDTALANTSKIEPIQNAMDRYRQYGARPRKGKSNGVKRNCKYPCSIPWIIASVVLASMLVGYTNPFR